MKHAVILALSSLALMACTTWQPVENAPREDGVSVLFLADSQFHNIYGEHLLQGSLIASRAAKVARRPPETNLLARYVFADLIEQALDSRGKPLPVVVFLGDVTNVACSGEFDDFQNALSNSAAASYTALIAHGNHDSYLIGTSNRPHQGLDTGQDISMAALHESELPLDLDIWDWRKQTLGIGDTSWAKACFRPAFGDGSRPGVPLNKASWLAKYLESLKSHGLELEVLADATESGVRTRRFQAISNDGPLKEMNFELIGQYVSSKSNTNHLYDSFIVQAFDVGSSHRLILVDTSVCHDSPFPPSWSNAGSTGCMGKQQLDVVEDLVDKESDRKLVFAGHFPLQDIRHTDRKRFKQAMERTGQWTYISGHTHHERQSCDHGSGTEYNLGSTTDWPMEANLIHFEKTTKKVLPAETYNFKKQENAGPAYLLEVKEGERSDIHTTALYEVCRHFRTAEKLAKLKDYGDQWESPEATGECLEGLQNPDDTLRKAAWEKRANDLKVWVDEIDRRYQSEVEYQQAILKIATSASKHLYDRTDWYETVVAPFERSCR